MADALSRANQSEILTITSAALASILRIHTRSMSRSEHVGDCFDPSKDEKIDQPKVVEVLKEPTDRSVPKLVFFDDTETLLNYDRSILNKTRSKHVGFYQEIGVLMIRTPHQHISSKSLNSLRRDISRICSKYGITDVVLLSAELDKIACDNETRRKILTDICRDTPLRVLIVRNVIEVTDPDAKTQILHDHHFAKTGGHFGRDKMTKTIRAQYFWPGMNKDIVDLTNNCDSCKKSKHGRLQRQALTITTTSQKPFDKLNLDLFGPLPISDNGNKYVLTIQDDLSKFCLAFPISNAKQGGRHGL